MKAPGTNGMQELFHIIEEPRVCSYLPEEAASLDIRLVSSMSVAEYAGQMARGYRRFGMQVFRPACEACMECRSMRVPVQRFELTGSQRRVLRQNRYIRAELHPAITNHPAIARMEHIELFNRYHEFMHRQRGWPLQHEEPESYYRDFVLDPARCGRQWLYFNGDQLIGVALMDDVPGAISLVYCYYDPDWRDQSPGTFSILNQLLYAKYQGLDYAYFGYMVEGCASLNYKLRYQPREFLVGLPDDDEEPLWV